MNRKEYCSRPRRESVRKRIGSRRAAMLSARDRDKCVYCGGPPETFDHLIPRSMGGGDDLRNLVTACTRCNSARTDKSLEEWSVYARVTYGLIFCPGAITQRARRVPCES